MDDASIEGVHRVLRRGELKVAHGARASGILPTFESRIVELAEDDPGAKGPQAFCNREAYAAATTGNDGNLAVELKHRAVVSAHSFTPMLGLSQASCHRSRGCPESA